MPKEPFIIKATSPAGGEWSLHFEIFPLHNSSHPGYAEIKKIFDAPEEERLINCKERKLFFGKISLSESATELLLSAMSYGFNKTDVEVLLGIKEKWADRTKPEYPLGIHL